MYIPYEHVHILLPPLPMRSLQSLTIYCGLVCVNIYVCACRCCCIMIGFTSICLLLGIVLRMTPPLSLSLLAAQWYSSVTAGIATTAATTNTKRLNTTTTTTIVSQSALLPPLYLIWTLRMTLHVNFVVVVVVVDVPAAFQVSWFVERGVTFWLPRNPGFWVCERVCVCAMWK